jgi:hypothetical protein
LYSFYLSLEQHLTHFGGEIEAHLHRLSIYPSPMLVLCNEENSLMNKDSLKKCTVYLKQNNIMKISWAARRRMEFLQVPEH